MRKRFIVKEKRAKCFILLLKLCVINCNFDFKLSLTKKQKIDERVQELESENRKKNLEQLLKEKESWIFLTRVKQEKDRLISKNMYESAKLALLRS